MMDKTKSYPAMIFFSGGNYDYGNLKQFSLQANYFASRGVICIQAEYGNKYDRTNVILESNILESIADVKFCLGYFREQARQFNIDSKKIIASGASAGGYLALMTALSCCDDPNNNFKHSPKPNALVLFNPAIVKDSYKDLSPINKVVPGIPPAIIMQGTSDNITPVDTIKYFQHSLQSAGNRCDLFLYEGQPHGFFNYRVSKEYYQKTLLEVDKFLHSLGYIDGNPTIINEK
jgi:acetyl esterase